MTFCSRKEAKNLSNISSLSISDAFIHGRALSGFRFLDIGCEDDVRDTAKRSKFLLDIITVEQEIKNGQCSHFNSFNQTGQPDGQRTLANGASGGFEANTSHRKHYP